ncbi:hypothetical protein L7F22_055708 [Adiantum nelumboides]|nr:hypothetical protein [Adiantum nelumboides]
MLSPDLTSHEKVVYLHMLQQFPNLFITSYEEIRGFKGEEINIPIKEGAQSVHQKLRRMGQVQLNALKEEVDKLLKAGFIYPVSTADWVSTVTPKKDGKWRVCVDYKPLNAAMKRDPYPLPFIDDILDSVAGRCIGGDKKRSSRAADNVRDKESGRDDVTSSKGIRSMSLAELRLQQLKAAEARLHSSTNEASAASLTPLGRIFKVSKRADKLEEETQSFLGKVSAAKVMSPSEEKEQVRLLEELTVLQLEIDGIPGDESVRPHRKCQTNRIQTLLASLDQLECCEILAGTLFVDAVE